MPDVVRLKDVIYQTCCTAHMHERDMRSLLDVEQLVTL